MATETENGRIVQDTDDSTPEPSFYDQKDARQVIGKIISSNFAVMVAGLNGQYLWSIRTYEKLRTDHV